MSTPPAPGLPKDVKRLVTSPTGACFMLDCGRDRLYSLLASGEIESFTDGHRRKILVASIDAFIARRLAARDFTPNSRRPARKWVTRLLQEIASAEDHTSAEAVVAQVGDRVATLPSTEREQVHEQIADAIQERFGTTAE